MAPKHSIAQTKFYLIILALVIFSLLLASCGANPTAAPTPDLTISTPTTEIVLATPVATLPTGPAATQPPANTPVQANTATAVPVVPTATSLLAPTATATAVLANPTIQPAAAVNAVTSGNIVFTPGTTAAVVLGTTQPGQILTYTLDAAQGQPLILIMDAPQNDVTLGVFEPNGNVVLNPANRWTKWQAILPATERYTIQVMGGATVENFDLTVKVAQVVNFATGTSSSTLNGTTINGYLFDYALTCAGGQTMSAALNVPASTAYLDIFGMVSGTLLADAARANNWTGVLPQTQQYVVEVVPINGQVINYSLTVSCTGTPVNNPNSTSDVGSVTIAPGSTAAVRHGTVGPGQVVTYTLQGNQYQPLILNLGAVGASKNDAFLGVLLPDGSTFVSPSKKYLNWQWRLPVTGMYTIQVVGGATTESYELTIKLPRIVNFAAGTSSTTIKSATEQGFIVSYALYGNSGQTMTVSLNVSPDVAYLDIFGLESGGILSYKDMASTWTGVLKQTEQVIVEVIPRGGQIVQYSVTISMH